MKIINKIVTSQTAPKTTNVLWHNPETGELKIFGNTGWELAGGGKLPEIVESGWELDKETGGIATKIVLEKPNTCSYKTSFNPEYEGWKFITNPTLSVGESIELIEVGTNKKVNVTVTGLISGPYSGYKLEGELDSSKTYRFGSFLLEINNIASSLGAVSEGGGYFDITGIPVFNTSSGESSHSEGYGTVASGFASHAEGNYTTASGDYSHSEGDGTIASSGRQHVQGKYNIDDPNDVYQFIIGNGIHPGDRSNAFAVKWDGTIVLWKDVNTPLELTPSKLEKLLALVD